MRRSRIFLSRKNSRWSVSAFIDRYDNLLYKLANSIQKGNGRKFLRDPVINGVNWFKAPIDKLHEFLKSILLDKFQPLFFEYKALKKDIKAFMTDNILIKQLIKFFKCFLENNLVPKGHLLNLVKTLIKIVENIKTHDGWVEYVINSICGWNDIVDAVPHLKNAEETNDINFKYISFGKFVAHFSMAMTG